MTDDRSHVTNVTAGGADYAFAASPASMATIPTLAKAETIFLFDLAVG
jgi:hypothetical protein